MLQAGSLHYEKRATELSGLRKMADQSDVFLSTSWLCIGGILFAVAGCNRTDDSATTASAPIETPEQITETETVNTRPVDVRPPDPASLVDAAIEALGNGDTLSALSSAQRAETLDPENPDVQFILARALGARNRFHEAVRILDALAAEHPETQLFSIGQTAEWLVEMGDGVEAEKRYRDLRTKVDARSQPMVDRQLARLFIRQGRRLEAASVIRDLCRAGDIELAELLLLLQVAYPVSDGMTFSSTLEPISDTGEAMVKIASGQWDEALAKLDEADKSPDVVALRGRIHARQPDSDALEEWVLDDYDSARDIPNSKYAWGIYQLQIGQADEAAKAFASVVVADPTDVDAYVGFAKSLASLQRAEDAERVDARADLIRQTQEIGAQVAQGTARVPEIRTLVDLLQRLQRPMESLAWQAISTSYQQGGGEIDSAEASRRYAEIARQRLEQQASEPSKEFILCDVDLAKDPGP